MFSSKFFGSFQLALLSEIARYCQTVGAESPSSFSQKHRRCLGSRLGDYGRSEIECQDPVDGRWTSCGRAGAAEIAWEEARDGGARLKGMIRWTGRELQK